MIDNITSEGKKQMIDIILYTKPDCSLCEEAKLILAGFSDRYPYRLEEVDITQDEGLYSLYRYHIPVFVIHGQEVFAPINGGKLEAALTAA